MKNKLKKEKIKSEFRSLLPTNIGGRIYFKRMQKESGNSENKSKIKKEEKKNVSFESIKEPFTYKVIKNLLKTEEELQRKLLKIQENEKLIKSKSYLNLFNKNPMNIKKDMEIIKDKANDLSKNKSLVLSRAEYINSQIYNLQNQKDRETGDMKNRIIQNLNKFNQNLVLLKDKKQNNKKNDNKYNNKIIKLFNPKEEEKILEEQKLFALKHMREVERDEIKKRKEKNKEKTLKSLRYIKEKPKKEYYLYEKFYNNYMDREDNLVKKENAKRKAYMRHINSSEFLEMEKTYQARKIKMEENSKENKQILKQEWSERQKLIPNYNNPFIKVLNKEKEKIEQEKESKKNTIIKHKNNMINFSNKLRKPDKWKEKHENNSSGKEDKSKIFNQIFAIKNNYSDIVRKKMYRRNKKSRENDKKNNNVLLDDKNKKIENKNNLNKINNDNVSKYLEDKRKKPKPKLNNIYANDIKKYLEKSGITENSLFMSKYKLDYLIEKKKRKDKEIKLNGGIVKNPKASEELFNLSINIINGKLAILEQIDKEFNEHENDGNNTDKKEGSGSKLENYSNEEEEEEEEVEVEQKDE